ncbi:MAG: hypothetical protein WC091_18150 [Sulfuricellaceae bacterium]
MNSAIPPPAAHIQNGVNAMARCLSWLQTEGFQPIKAVADIQFAHPTITISVCGRCEWLKSAYHAEKFEETRFGRRTVTWSAGIFECFVEWKERGH